VQSDPHDEPEPHGSELDRLREAAYEAERETGRREQTDAQARASIRLRVARMTVGFTVLVIGVALLVLPGPGWLCIAAGLAILSRDVAWAERALEKVRSRLPADSDGKVPKSVVIGSIVLMLAAAAVSVWFWLS
jgi:uncharacterized protein (TIGR02611 family)